MTACSLHAEGPSIKITLAIRDTRLLSFTNLSNPLAFRIQNTGQTIIKADAIPAFFFKGIIHIQTEAGPEQYTNFQKIWRTMVRDLPPGETFESPVYADLLTYFPTANDGVYQVWWTLDELKSNTLRFTVTNGKLSADTPRQAP